MKVPSITDSPLWFAAVLSLSVATSLPAAVTINWGNAPSITTINFDSMGQPLDNTDYIFEFGVFGTGGPIGAPSTWRSQWTVLDTPDSGYNQGLQVFQDTWIGTDNTYAGDQAHIWIHNSDFTATPDSEWAIVTADDWIIPQMGDQQQLPLEFRVTMLDQTDELFPADTIVFGGLAGEQGPGVFEQSPSDFKLQTHTFVPEPTPTLLILLAGGFTLLRRRRNGSPG